MQRGSDQFNIRLPYGLRDKIRVSAAYSRRSMNAEIIYHLERALSAHEALAGVLTPISPPASARETTASHGSMLQHQG